MPDEKFMTLHPENGKSGVNISKHKYEQMRKAITETLQGEGELTFGELRDMVGQRLDGRFDGSISWYYTTVKLDLEARGIIERVNSRSPQRLHLVPNLDSKEHR